MAGVPAGPNAFFRVGPAELTKPECFAVERGEAQNRLDAWFNHPRYALLNDKLDSSAFQAPELGEVLVSIAGGATPTRSDASLYAGEGIRFLRILNVDDGEINDHDLKYITNAVHNGVLGRSQLEVDDILMTITGRVGSAAVVRKEHLPGNINQHIARLRIAPQRARPEFVSEWLNSPAGLALSNRYVSGGTRAALDYGAIRSLRIPLPDALSEQDRLIASMATARAERKAKLSEADMLLSSLDDFVLDALGITPPVEDRRRNYGVTFAQVRTQMRLNSDYYHPERTAALRLLDSVDTVRLADVVQFRRDPLRAPTETYLSLAHVQSHTGELTDASDTASGNCFAYEMNDVLFARLRPYLNKVHRAETDGSCSTEFHVLRISDTRRVLPDYLAAILRSKVVLAQTVHMMTGNTHPRLANADVENLRVPIPEMDIQEAIAAEVICRREESRQIKAAAEAAWGEAKRWFEEQLLAPRTL